MSEAIVEEIPRTETGPEWQQSSCTVLIPAYNEREAISHVVRDVTSALAQWEETIEILVIDDGSSDGTGDEAAKLGARVVKHLNNRGYGSALKTGLRNAQGDYIVIIDADGTYPAERIPELLNELSRCDMAVGSRVGDNVNVPMERRPMKWVLKQFAQFLSGQRIPDLNSGLRAFRKADALRFLSLYPSGFSFTTTISLAFLCNDMLVHYIPIDYHERMGHSKLRPIRDTKNLFLTVIRCILFFNPLRVCIPASMVMFMVALALGLWVRDADGRILDGTITILVTCGLQIIIVGFLADILSRFVRD